MDRNLLKYQVDLSKYCKIDPKAPQVTVRSPCVPKRALLRALYNCMIEYKYPVHTVNTLKV
jgi:hypothetical protein